MRAAGDRDGGIVQDGTSRGPEKGHRRDFGYAFASGRSPSREGRGSVGKLEAADGISTV
jgi:hypothetical protein